MAKATCSIEGCNKDRLARGFCDKHYYRWRKHGSPAIGEFVAALPPQPCGPCEWCGATFTKKVRTDRPRPRFCNRVCANRAKAAGRPYRITDGKGYVLLWKPDHPNAQGTGYIREHRLVVSDALGRPLRADEVIHHKNGVKHDNGLENLELMNASQHSGLRNAPTHCPHCGEALGL